MNWGMVTCLILTWMVNCCVVQSFVSCWFLMAEYQKYCKPRVVNNNSFNAEEVTRTKWSLAVISPIPFSFLSVESPNYIYV